MKKLLAVIMLAILALTACAPTTSTEPFIRPSEFSSETKKVLELFDDEIHFFDISLDEAAKSHTISVWVYRDGAWTEDGRTTGGIESLQGQIAIRLTESSYDLYVIDESGHMKYSYPALETDFEAATATSGTVITQTTPLVLNKETPILVKIGTDKNSMQGMDISEDFRNLECSAGIAITLTISDTLVA